MVTDKQTIWVDGWQVHAIYSCYSNPHRPISVIKTFPSFTEAQQYCSALPLQDLLSVHSRFGHKVHPILVDVVPVPEVIEGEA